MPLLLGAIADDFTGATDLANTLSRNGMRCIQAIGVPEKDAQLDADAIVVALKSRTIPANEAVAQSLAACRWLKRNGARQFYFKYCSTFDSTDKGNIGPVADALLDELGSDFTIACPAFPENGRTIYQGHLFVGGMLLSQSSMRNHPLTPMTDSNLVGVLQRQTRHPVGLVAYADVSKGSSGIASAFTGLRARGVRHAIVDAVEDRHLEALGAACEGLALVTGGSGAAIGLPANFRNAGLLEDRQEVEPLPEVGGLALVLSGSCSPATLAQNDAMAATHPSFTLDALSLSRNFAATVADLLAKVRPLLADGPALIRAGLPPADIEKVQAQLGREQSGAIVEQAFADIARALVGEGVRRFVVAGGETSGAVVRALNVTALQIGPQIDPGVPATLSLGEPRIALALKSGNFGSPGFFAKALRALA